MQADLLGNSSGQLRRQRKDFGMKRKTMTEVVLKRFVAFCVLLLLGFLFPPLSLRVSSPTSRIRHGHEAGAFKHSSSGKWALDASRMPLYASDCPFHRTAWNCGKNRRPAARRMSQWVWVTSAFSRVQPHSLLQAMRGMRVGFIGDSLNENFMVSLACTLSAADSNARKWKRNRAWRGAHFPAFNVTVAYHRAVLLAKHDVPGFRVDVDVPADDWANVTDSYDVLIFNTGHWWGYDKFPKESPLVFYRGGQPLWPPLSLREGLAAVLTSMLDFIDHRVPAKVLKVWRLQSPRHFQGGDWNQNGSCSTSELLNETQVEEWFDPAHRGVNREEREVNQVIRSALRGREKYVVLDVATMSEFRADAHPSRWLGSQDAHLVWGQDCLHWCLPGVPDVWVDMLAALVVSHIEAAPHSTLGI